MIVNHIDDLFEEEFAYSKNLQFVVKFIKEKGLEGILAYENGKYTLTSDGGVKLNRSSYVGKEKDVARLENHDKWLDFQLVLDNVEDIGYCDKRKVTEKNITVPYNEEKDVTFYSAPLDATIRLTKGFFVLVYPNDLHKPCIKVNDEVIQKAVFKIKIDW
jgi:YhcH/YjgK/YiaL family protein